MLPATSIGSCLEINCSKARGHFQRPPRKQTSSVLPVDVHCPDNTRGTLAHHSGSLPASCGLLELREMCPLQKDRYNVEL